MAKMEGGVKILLDIDKVLNDEEIAALGRAALVNVKDGKGRFWRF